MRCLLTITICFFVFGQNIQLENVYDLEFYFSPEIENWYTRNYQKNIKSQIWILSDIYDSPNSASIKIGELITYYEPQENNYILQFRRDSLTVAKEIRHIGDWGYGIHMNVIDKTKEFARLPDAYFDQESWLGIKKGEKSIGLNADVISYVNQIVVLPKMKAMDLNSKTIVEINRGRYFVEKRQTGEFIIREEIPSDMPCGLEEIEKIDLQTLPRYKIKLDDLLGSDGDIRIDVAYKKGC